MFCKLIFFLGWWRHDSWTSGVSWPVHVKESEGVLDGLLTQWCQLTYQAVREACHILCKFTLASAFFFKHPLHFSSFEVRERCGSKADMQWTRLCFMGAFRSSLLTEALVVILQSVPNCITFTTLILPFAVHLYNPLQHFSSIFSHHDFLTVQLSLLWTPFFSLKSFSSWTFFITYRWINHCITLPVCDACPHREIKSRFCP